MLDRSAGEALERQRRGGEAGQKNFLPMEKALPTR